MSTLRPVHGRLRLVFWTQWNTPVPGEHDGLLSVANCCGIEISGKVVQYTEGCFDQTLQRYVVPTGAFHQNRHCVCGSHGSQTMRRGVWRIPREFEDHEYLSCAEGYLFLAFVSRWTCKLTISHERSYSLALVVLWH